MFWHCQNNKEAESTTTVPVDQDHGNRSSGSQIFKKCCMSDEVGNVGSEHECVSSECETQDGNCEDIKAETDNRNHEQSKTGRAE
jgi:hypothetical protein